MGCIHLDEIRFGCENVQPHVNFGHGFNLTFFVNANKLMSHGTNCHVLLQGFFDLAGKSASTSLCSLCGNLALVESHFRHTSF